jgi:hypothetical protein
MAEGHHPEPGAAGGHSPAGGSQAVFSPGDIVKLQTEDRQAARNIVVLLTGVFITGLILYTVIAFIVSSGP